MRLDPLMGKARGKIKSGAGVPKAVWCCLQHLTGNSCGVSGPKCIGHRLSFGATTDAERGDPLCGLQPILHINITQSCALERTLQLRLTASHFIHDESYTTHYVRIYGSHNTDDVRGHQFVCEFYIANIPWTNITIQICTKEPFAVGVSVFPEKSVTKVCGSTKR